jgi:hypothetical protein
LLNPLERKGYFKNKENNNMKYISLLRNIKFKSVVDAFIIGA